MAGLAEVHQVAHGAILFVFVNVVDGSNHGMILFVPGMGGKVGSLIKFHATLLTAMIGALSDLGLYQVALPKVGIITHDVASNRDN